MIEVVDATEAHGAYIADRLRKVDREELALFTGKTPQEEVSETLIMSTFKWAVLVDGIPVILMGAAPTWANDADRSRALAVWLFGTEEFKKARPFLLRGVRDYIDKLFSQADVLFNWISSENCDIIKWLEWLGFTVYDADPNDHFAGRARFFQMWGPKNVLC